jgi:hypothetical protein
VDEEIEISLDSPDGVIDCRLEPQKADGALSYSVTILYPNVVNGYSRSEIFCYILRQQGHAYVFDMNEDGVHPKIQKLEAQLSHAIMNAK